MSELAKRIIYATVGTASVTNEKFKELIEDLIQNDHFTEDEGKRIVDDFLFNLRGRVDSVHTLMQERVNLILNKMGLSDFYTLKEEIEHYVQDVKENPVALLKFPIKR